MSPPGTSISHTGNVPVSSDHPFDALEATTSVREDGLVTRSMIRVPAPTPDVPFRLQRPNERAIEFFEY